MSEKSEQKVYRGIPERARKQKIPMYYASGPQPAQVVAMNRRHIKAQMSLRKVIVLPRADMTSVIDAPGRIEE